MKQSIHLILRSSLAALLCASSLFAAPIVVENQKIFIDTGSPTSAMIANFAVAEGSDRKLVVIANWEGAKDITNITYGTQPLTKASHVFQLRGSTIWYLDSPPVGTDDITATFPVPMNGVIVGALSLQNAAPGGPAIARQTSGNTVSLTTPAANTFVVGGYIENTAGPGVTSPFSSSLYALGGISAFGSAGYQKEATAGTKTFTWTTPASDSNVVAVAGFAAALGDNESSPPRVISENPQVTELSASVRSGQIFLTWDEEPGVDGITYDVFMHASPITAQTLGDAQKVGHHVEAGSACDWWKNPASFKATAAADRSYGFIIDGNELDPSGGLFVHTVGEADPATMYFAVLPATASASDLVSGENALAKGVTAIVALPQPSQLKAAPDAGSAVGKSLTLVLHGRGGGGDKNDTSNFVVFGDSKQGWRQGLARKFIVSSDANGIIITPRDWLWVGRPLLFSGDARDHGLAINTWWYGCNDHIYDAGAVPNGVVVNYTEAHLLYLVRWAQQHFGTDPQKTYLVGTSMGGSGAISVGFHHPDVFATIYSQVPVVAYTRRSSADGRSNLHRLDGLSGRVCDETVMSDEGMSVMERMNSERIVRDYDGELPFLVLCNGRKDGSIPWVNNPSFYRALNKAKRGFAAYWNNGKHDMWKHVPADVTEFYTTQALEQGDSYPAFSNDSDNRNAGDGERDNGDLIGWMNRGIYWSDVVETENSWSLSLHAKGDFLPDSVTVDVTPRKLTKFQIAPHETLLVNGTPIQADANGRLTVTQVQISKGTSHFLQIQRSN